MVETLKGRTPVSSTFRPTSEWAPSGVTPFKTIEAPRSSVVKLTRPTTPQINPDKVYRGNVAATEVVSKAPSVVTPKRNLMPPGVTSFVEIPVPRKTRAAKSRVQAAPKPDIAAYMPKGLTNVRFIDAPPAYPTISKPASRPIFDGIRKIVPVKEAAKPTVDIKKPTPVTFWPERISHKTIVRPSRNIFTALPLQKRIIDTPRPKVDIGRASVISPPNRANIFSREQVQPITVPRTKMIKIQPTPLTELRTSYINQAIISPVTRKDTVRPLRTFEKKAELVIPATKLLLQEMAKPSVVVEMKTATQVTERLQKTPRTQLKRREMSTIKKEQQSHRVAIRESLKHAHKAYENFKAAGLAPTEAYKKSTLALQAAMEKENVPVPVIQRVISVRTRRLHLKFERRTAITVLRRSEIIVKSRKFTKKEESSVKQKEHKARPIEMILIEDIPTKKLRELIFNQVIENLPGKTATWYDVVRGVMEHPWMPKMNSPLLYNIYPHHIISKYLVDGLLLHRMREWLKIKEPQTKENLKSIVKDVLDITPAVTASIKKANSPQPLNEETVEIIVKGDKTEPKVERRSIS